jgi:hypothetical protein
MPTPQIPPQINCFNYLSFSQNLCIKFFIHKQHNWNELWRWLSSGLLYCVAWWKYINVSEVQQPRRRPSSYSLLWEPQSHKINFVCCNGISSNTGFFLMSVWIFWHNQNSKVLHYSEWNTKLPVYIYKFCQPPTPRTHTYMCVCVRMCVLTEYIWGSHSRGYEDGCLLCYSAV